jgi:Protein of unknown function (DUF2695)
MDKGKRKVILNQLAQKNALDFKNGLPFEEPLFLKLFDFLDNKLSEEYCKDDFSFAKEFCEIEKIDTEILFKWLNEQGQCCDCEILNLEDAFQHLNQIVKKPKVQTQIKKQKLNNLITDFGFSIDKIISPWTLTETILADKSIYTFQIGKGTDCIVTLAKTFPTEQFDNDNYWLDIWAKETELDYDIEDLTVERPQLENFYCVLVKSKRWIPIIYWFKHKVTDKWFLKMQTGSIRHKGDIKEFEKILNNIRAEKE